MTNQQRAAQHSNHLTEQSEAALRDTIRDLGEEQADIIGWLLHEQPLSLRRLSDEKLEFIAGMAVRDRCPWPAEIMGW